MQALQFSKYLFNKRKEFEEFLELFGLGHRVLLRPLESLSLCSISLRRIERASLTVTNYAVKFLFLYIYTLEYKLIAISRLFVNSCLWDWSIYSTKLCHSAIGRKEEKEEGGVGGKRGRCERPATAIRSFQLVRKVHQQETLMNFAVAINDKCHPSMGGAVAR